MTGYTRLRRSFVSNKMRHIFEILHADDTRLHAVRHGYMQLDTELQIYRFVSRFVSRFMSLNVLQKTKGLH